MSPLGKFVVVTFLLACFAASACAANIPLVTSNGTTVLDDDFEAPAAPAAPIAAVGTWLTPAATGTGAIVAGSTAHAAQGLQSVQVTRPVGTSAILGGNFSATATNQTLDARFMIYVTDPVGTALPNVFFSDSGGLGAGSGVGMTPIHNTANGGTAIDSIRLIVGTFGTTTPVYSSSLFAAFQTNTWQKWEIVHTVGTNTATFSINGVSQTATGLNGALTPTNTTSIAALEFFGGPSGSTTYYVDAVPVPEPSSLLILAIGGVLAYSRRRRTRV